jgi:predicted dehydrogenase
MVHRIGLIGAGIMGRRMADRVAAHPEFALVAAWDPDRAALESLRKAHPATALADDARALTARDDVDCVYIAAPPASHATHAQAAFDRGKAVFCEKPLTVDDGEGAALVARAERERRKAGVNFSLATAPSFARIAEAVSSGALGRIETIEIHVRFARWPRGWQHGAATWLTGAREGGFVREVVSHFVFTTQRLVGPLAVRSSKVERASAQDAERAIAAEMKAGDVRVTLDGRVAGEADDHNLWTVTGTRGAMRIRDWHGLERADRGTWSTVESSSIEAMRVQAGLAQLDQLAAVIEGRPNSLPTLREALDVQRTIEALLRG